jgi:phosphate/sulfate permease
VDVHVRRLRAKLGAAGRILSAWILPIPASALVAAGTWLLLRALM